MKSFTDVEHITYLQESRRRLIDDIGAVSVSFLTVAELRKLNSILDTDAAHTEHWDHMIDLKDEIDFLTELIQRTKR